MNELNLSMKDLDRLGFYSLEVGMDGMFKDGNRNFYEATGYSPEQLRHIPAGTFQTISGAEISPEKAGEQIKQSGAPLFSLRYRLKTPGGEEIDLEGTLDLNSSGNLAGLFADITHHIQSEDSLQKSVLASEHEMEIGRRIQQSFLPTSIPEPDGWNIAAELIPAREVAGDFYDVFSISNGRRTCLLIGDVVDKGVGAALFMALFRSLIRAFADQHHSLSWMDVIADDPLEKLSKEDSGLGNRRRMLSTGTTALKNAVVQTNNYIARYHESANMFATIFLGVLDPVSGVMMYINGGHDPPFLVNSGVIKEKLMPTGPIVGMMPRMEFKIDQVQFEPGDMLVTYTDGVLDAMNMQRERFGEDRLLSILESNGQNPAGLLEKFRTGILDFIDSQNQYDDITMLLMQRETVPQDQKR